MVGYKFAILENNYEICMRIHSNSQKNVLSFAQKRRLGSIELKLRHDVVYYVIDALIKFRDFKRSG
jgi:hypothetical protein